MSSTSQLERIAGLVEQLGPIAKKQKGMRIEAEEWNALVDVLLGVLKIDRAQEQSSQVTLEQRFAVKVHEHLGEIGLTWLDAELQSRLGSQQGAVPTRTALAELAHKFQGIGDEVARLTTLSESLGKLIDRSQVDDVDRSRTLSRFETRFAGVENLRTLVSTLSTDVGGVKGNIDTLLELRKSLSDAQGNPIDIARLQSELGEVQGLRENLKGVSGDLLRLKDIELKLNEVADAAGVGAAGGLDQRLSELASSMETRLNGGFDERSNGLQQALAEQNAASEVRLQSALSGSLEARAQALEQSLAGKIADSESRLGQSVDSKIAASVGSVRQQADASAKSLIEARLAGIPEQVKATTVEMIAGLRAELVGELSVSLKKDIQTRFTTLEATMNTRLGVIEGRVSSFAEQIPTLVAGRVDEARQALEASISLQLDDQITASQTALEQNLAGRIKEALDRQQAKLAETINGSVTQLRGEISALRTEVDNTIDARIKTTDTSLQKSLSTEFKKFESRLKPDVFRTTIGRTPQTPITPIQ